MTLGTEREHRPTTPIKEIWVITNTVFALDHANKLSFMVACEDEESANQIGLLLGSHHNKETYAFKPSHRRMVPLGGSS
jgi:hypothetical protein